MEGEIGAQRGKGRLSRRGDGGVQLLPQKLPCALCDLVEQKNQRYEHGADLKVERGFRFRSWLLLARKSF